MNTLGLRTLATTNAGVGQVVQTSDGKVVSTDPISWTKSTLGNPTAVITWFDAVATFSIWGATIAMFASNKDWRDDNSVVTGSYNSDEGVYNTVAVVFNAAIGLIVATTFRFVGCVFYLSQYYGACAQLRSYYTYSILDGFGAVYLGLITACIVASALPSDAISLTGIFMLRLVASITWNDFEVAARTVSTKEFVWWHLLRGVFFELLAVSLPVSVWGMLTEKAGNGMVVAGEVVLILYSVAVIVVNVYLVMSLDSVFKMVIATAPQKFPSNLMIERRIDPENDDLTGDVLEPKLSMPTGSGKIRTLTPEGNVYWNTIRTWGIAKLAVSAVFAFALSIFVIADPASIGDNDNTRDRAQDGATTILNQGKIAPTVMTLRNLQSMEDDQHTNNSIDTAMSLLSDNVTNVRNLMAVQSCEYGTVIQNDGCRRVFGLSSWLKGSRVYFSVAKGIGYPCDEVGSTMEIFESSQFDSETYRSALCQAAEGRGYGGCQAFDVNCALTSKKGAAQGSNFYKPIWVGSSGSGTECKAKVNGLFKSTSSLSKIDHYKMPDTDLMDATLACAPGTAYIDVTGEKNTDINDYTHLGMEKNVDVKLVVSYGSVGIGQAPYSTWINNSGKEWSPPNGVSIPITAEQVKYKPREYVEHFGGWGSRPHGSGEDYRWFTSNDMHWLRSKSVRSGLRECLEYTWSLLVRDADLTFMPGGNTANGWMPPWLSASNSRSGTPTPSITPTAGAATVISLPWHMHDLNNRLKACTVSHARYRFSILQFVPVIVDAAAEMVLISLLDDQAMPVGDCMSQWLHLNGMAVCSPRWVYSAV